MMQGYDHGLWMSIGWIGMFFLWLAPIVVLLAALKYLFGGSSSRGRKTALDLLEEAYARGEISREEFLQKRDDLQRK